MLVVDDEASSVGFATTLLGNIGCPGDVVAECAAERTDRAR